MGSACPESERSGATLNDSDAAGRPWLRQSVESQRSLGPQLSRHEARYSTRVNSDTRAVHSDPEIMGGTPVFAGTRVPFQTLLDYLEAGDPLGDFLEDFPTVSRALAVAALEQAKEALIARENPS